MFTKNRIINVMVMILVGSCGFLIGIIITSQTDHVDIIIPARCKKRIEAVKKYDPKYTLMESIIYDYAMNYAGGVYAFVAGGQLMVTLNTREEVQPISTACTVVFALPLRLGRAFLLRTEVIPLFHRRCHEEFDKKIFGKDLSPNRPYLYAGWLDLNCLKGKVPDGATVIGYIFIARPSGGIKILAFSAKWNGTTFSEFTIHHI